MKYKLKELDFKEFSFNKTNIESGTLINLKYKNDSLEFQTPKVIIENLIKENDHEYLLLKILPTKACKDFCSKITQLENFFKETLKNDIKSVFSEDLFTVKIPFKYSKPIIKIYNETGLFNYYKLSNNTTVICLLALDKIWVNQYNEPNYNLIVKEIMVI
jgi:hypothetical protein